MERERFDRLAKTIGAAPSRRRLLGLAASSVLTAVGLRPNEAKAKRKRCHVEAGDGRCLHEVCVIHCKNPGGCDNHKDPLPRCGPSRLECGCVELLSGESACVGPRHPKELCQEDRCNSNRDCPIGRVCARVPGCCPDGAHHCVFTCQ